MIIYLTAISKECFSVGVNDSLKFLRALGRLSEGTQATGNSEGTRRALEGYSGTWALKAFMHSST